MQNFSKKFMFLFLWGMFFSISTFASLTEDEEYNFSWLDPDKKVYVLQNRKYKKAKRFGAVLSGGVHLSNPYRSSYIGIPRFTYAITEQFGAEAFFGAATNSENGNFEALKNASPTALPFVREVRNFYGIIGTWTPWYAKLNFFNKILYFDWQFNAGLGQTSTAFDQNRRAGAASDFKDENLFTFFFGTAQSYFVTQNVIVRLDLIGSAYSATGADNLSKRTVTNFNFAAGVGYLF